MSAVRVIDGEAADLFALEAALRVDPQVRGVPGDRVVADSMAGGIGPVVEALTWAADNKELLGGVAAALAAWVASGGLGYGSGWVGGRSRSAAPPSRTRRHSR
jgi:hypothetical protein